MVEPPLSPDEPFRLAALRAMNVLDTPINERFERITRLARRVLDMPIAAVSLVDRRRQWFKSIQGLDATETTREVSFCGHTILQDGIFIVHDAREDDRFASNPLVTGPPRIVFYAGCPLVAPDGSAVGSLCVIDYERRSLDGDDRASLRDLAALVEAELSASLMGSVQSDLITQIAEEKRQALVDPLTRLWNRDGIFNLLASGHQRALREAGGFAVIMADMDRFKSINDTKGHPAGDEVLRQAARRMLGAIRGEDAIGRYGGEEFMIVLGTCHGPDEATAVAERLRRHMSETPIEIGDDSLNVTVSLGIAYVPPGSAVDIDSMVVSADAALYRAKNAGRDRWELQIIDADDPSCGIESCVDPKPRRAS